MSMRRPLVLAIVLLQGLLLLGQSTPPGDKSLGLLPLSEQEVESGLQQGIPAARMKTLVEQYGVSFEVTQEVEARLRNAGGDAEVVLAAVRNKRTMPAGYDPVQTAKINAMIRTTNEAITAQRWTEVEADCQQLIQLDASRWEYWMQLGRAQFALNKFADAADAYDHGVKAAKALPQSDTDPKLRASIGAMLVNEGNAYIKLKQPEKAPPLYDEAAKYDPHPATAYFNLCALYYNMGKPEDALAACDRVIALDPNGHPDAYFIRGSILVGDSKVDAKGKFAAPPGTAEALRKYLELAPNGPHANDVRQMLQVVEP